MNTTPRRAALIGACATAAALLTKAEAVADNPQLAGIQALVSDLRNVHPNIPMCVFVAFQETADRLKTLPGIVPVSNKMWERWKATLKEERANSEWPIGPYLTAGRA